MSVETIQITPTIRAVIDYDQDADSPENWDQLGKIAYSSSRYTLGTENVSRERLDEISRGIENGTLIGTEVYAYCHGGSMIAAGTRLKNGTYALHNPFSCPWDSGQSGFVYVEKAKALAECGHKILTAKAKAQTLQILAGEVACFSQYLEGDVYAITIEHLVDAEWEMTDSCCGFYGLDYAKEEALAMGQHQAGIDSKQEQEAECVA
jgi:hypothetical protein